MRKTTFLFTLIIFITLDYTSFGQRIDSTLAIGGITQDTFHIIHKNIPKSKLLGNSWNVSTSYNLNKTNEFDINIGRTFGLSSCGGAGCIYNMRSWGAGFGLTNRKGQTNQIAKVFWEHCFFYFPPFSAGIRADYLYDLNSNSHYLRPSFGLSLFFLDIFYNYSFNISGTENIFKHGVSIRIKYFHKRENWQENYPSRC